MSPLIRLNPACYARDIQAINAGSPDVHCAPKCTVQKGVRGVGEKV